MKAIASAEKNCGGATAFVPTLTSVMSILTGTRDTARAAQEAVIRMARLSIPHADRAVSRAASIGAVVSSTKGVRRRYLAPAAAKTTRARTSHNLRLRGWSASNSAPASR